MGVNEQKKKVAYNWPRLSDCQPVSTNDAVAAEIVEEFFHH